MEENENKVQEEVQTDAVSESTKSKMEDYGEVQEQNAKAEKPRRKKIGGKKLALIIVAAVLAAILVAVGLFFLIQTILYKPHKYVNLNLDNKYPSIYAVQYNSGELDAIQAAIALAEKETLTAAEETQIKQVMSMMYAKANNLKINAPQALTVSVGRGNAQVKVPAFKPKGEMVVKSFKAQYGSSLYYQKAAVVSDCNVPQVTDIVKDLLNQQERNYVNGGVYKSISLKGADAGVADEELEFLPYMNMTTDVANKPLTETEYRNKAYVLNDPNEVSNFNINENTIVLKELEEGFKYITYNAEEKYYELRFSLAIEDDNPYREECVRVARQYLRDSSSSENLQFEKFDVVMQIWDNGYIKKYHDDEIWAGKVEKGVIKSDTKSTTEYNCVYFWEFDEGLFNEQDAAKYNKSNWAQLIIEDYASKVGWNK